MISLIVHGGAWDIPDDMLEFHRIGVQKALTIGWEILSKGGSALDAVEKSINYLEDDPTFDAGKGSFVNASGEIELDASIMEGKTLNAGAVASVQNIKNPITLARCVMEKSEHVLLSGEGAQRFAFEHGIQKCKRDDLLTERELQRWKEFQSQKNLSIKETFGKKFPKTPSDTVGAVAMDKNGLIVAGTSTGGTPNKHPGRVGDSPLIGCGNYADNSVGGVSCTGWGEGIIRVALAKTVMDVLEHNGGKGSEAAKKSIKILQEKVQGLAGVIVLNHKGVPSVAFNTPRMARAYRTSEMKKEIVEV